MVGTQREDQVLELFKTWGPEELARREATKTETERRRLARERQVAEEKAETAITELKKHLRSGNGKTQLKQGTRDHMVLHANAVSFSRAREAFESDLLSRCLAAHFDMNVHE